ncbi:hypothetical protein CXB51_003377 [Gossypium anomalum]|uniref:CDP-diacylglycerol--glycerol-3-phosphate 3-phosphatidyltransferase n=1 Tax=Gossypium anomalum TaxID=47600 RepID=A0A8J5ZGD2_9ROSI|nr:hypothetical protein CXB51_003377 [Gossypium anomalum]
MSGLKLSLAASIYVKPRQWVRTITTTRPPPPPPPPLRLTRRMTALFSPSTHFSNSLLPKKTLLPLVRFAFPNCFSSSTNNKGAINGSGPGSDRILADMDPDSKPSPLIEPQPQMRDPNFPSDNSSSKILTLPTVLTLGRVASVPLLIFTFYVDSWWGRTATTSIFVAAAITDWLDGYIARKMKLHSVFGAFLDPVADKTFECCQLWASAMATDSSIYSHYWKRVNNLGKWKTATQMVALTILLATRDSSLGEAGILVASGVILLYISAGLSVMSLAVYMGKIWQVLLNPVLYLAGLRIKPLLLEVPFELNCLNERSMNIDLWAIPRSYKFLDSFHVNINNDGLDVETRHLSFLSQCWLLKSKLD